MVIRRSLLAAVFFATGVARPCAAQSPESWQLVEELRIGSENGPDDSFATIRGLLPDGHGGILVLQSREIRWYSQSGSLVRVVGREGQGPGEFMDARKFGWMGDTLWVQDPTLGRVTMFDSAGNVAGTVPFRSPPLQNTLPTPPEIMLRGGRVVIKPRVNSAALIDGRVTDVPVLLFDRDRTFVDTVALFSQRHELLGITGGGGRLTVTQQPFKDSPLLVSLPDGSGFVIVRRPADDGPDFQLRRYDARGRLHRSAEQSYRPVPLRHEAVATFVESVASSLTRRFQSAGLPTGKLRRGIEGALYVPDHYPTVSAAFGATNGDVWIGRERVIGAASREWWDIDEEGRPVGRVQAPLASELLAATANAVWAVERDALGVSYVVRYRVVR